MVKSVVEKIKCQRINRYFFINPEGRNKNFYNFANGRVARQNRLIIIKI